MANEFIRIKETGKVAEVNASTAAVMVQQGYAVAVDGPDVEVAPAAPEAPVLAKEVRK